jgi:hypothetical protein
MMDLSDVVAVGAVVVVLALLAVSVASYIGNPVLDVADELTTTLPAPEAESVVADVLTAVPYTERRSVLPGTWTVSYRHHPRYAVLLGILAFPVGLLVILFVRETLVLTVTITSDAGGSKVAVVGRAHQKLALALGDALKGLVTAQPQPL